MNLMTGKNANARALMVALAAALMVSVGCGGEATLEERLIGEWEVEGMPGAGLIFHADGSGVERDGSERPGERGQLFTWEAEHTEPPQIIFLDDGSPVSATLLQLTSDRMRLAMRDEEFVLTRASGE